MRRTADVSLTVTHFILVILRLLRLYAMVNTIFRCIWQ